MSRRGDRWISRRDLLKAAGLVVLAGAALGGGAFALGRWEDSRYRNDSAGSYPTGDHRTEAELKEITYQGRTYRQKGSVESYLFLGIDEMGPAVGTQSYIAGGQADAQMLLVLDDAAKTWQLLQINRDSMVEVPVISMIYRPTANRPGPRLRQWPGAKLRKQSCCCLNNAGGSAH